MLIVCMANRIIQNKCNIKYVYQTLDMFIYSMSINIKTIKRYFFNLSIILGKLKKI